MKDVKVNFLLKNRVEKDVRVNFLHSVAKNYELMSYLFIYPRCKYRVKCEVAVASLGIILLSQK